MYIWFWLYASNQGTKKVYASIHASQAVVDIDDRMSGFGIKAFSLEVV
jgi:hypothetical protein